MSLNFGGGDADRVNCGSDTSLDNLGNFTFATWVYLDAVGASRGFTGKRYLSMQHDGSDATSLFAIQYDFGTTKSGSRTSGSGVLETAKWMFLACAFNSTPSSGRMKLYKGLLTSVVAECSYSATSDGTTGFDDAAYDWILGNSKDINASFDGRMAWCGLWNRELTLNELIEQQFAAHPTSGCVLFQELGHPGTGNQQDLSGSGNDGTVTGATEADHAPIIMGYNRPALLPSYPSGLPTIIVSGTNTSLVPSRDYWGPFTYSSKIHALAYQAADTPGIYATTTLDPSLGFTEKDGSNRPSANAGGAVVSCIGGASSDRIGMIMIGDASGDDPYFSEFRMDTQVWAETDDQIVAASQSNENVGIVWRSTAAEYVATFNGDLVSTYHMAYYSRRTGASTWTAPVALYTGTPVGDCFIQTTILGANDMVHFVIKYNGALYMRTLSADNTLSSWPPSFDSGETYEAVAAPVRYEE